MLGGKHGVKRCRTDQKGRSLRRRIAPWSRECTGISIIMARTALLGSMPTASMVTERRIQAPPEWRPMPRGPSGERCPTEVIGNAVRVIRIATNEEEDDREDAPPPSRAAQLGKLGGAAWARSLTPKQRKEIARKGPAKRWRRH
jgi:hypothetical protein